MHVASELLSTVYFSIPGDNNLPCVAANHCYLSSARSVPLSGVPPTHNQAIHAQSCMQPSPNRHSASNHHLCSHLGCHVEYDSILKWISAAQGACLVLPLILTWQSPALIIHLGQSDPVTACAAACGLGWLLCSCTGPLWKKYNAQRV